MEGNGLSVKKKKMASIIAVYFFEEKSWILNESKIRPMINFIKGMF